MTDLTLWGLFVSGFVSATLAPGGSEAVLAWAVSEGRWGLWVPLLVASVGNTLGALTSYLLGRFVHRHKAPASLLSGREGRALGWVERYGVWALLLAWLPVVGDAIPLLAGWFRLPALPSCVLIFVGKLARYAVVAAIAVGVWAV